LLFISINKRGEKMGMGKVTTWFMTPEELAEYVEKHPIVSTKQPSETKFSTDAIDHKAVAERRKVALEGNRIMDKVDKDVLHKLFMSGRRLADIAKSLKISEGNLSNYIQKQRKIEPEKWPCRIK
jgi:DNA-directed RNA polymerase specialized sigma subunit